MLSLLATIIAAIIAAWGIYDYAETGDDLATIRWMLLSVLCLLAAIADMIFQTG